MSTLAENTDEPDVGGNITATGYPQQPTRRLSTTKDDYESIVLEDAPRSQRLRWRWSEEGGLTGYATRLVIDI